MLHVIFVTVKPDGVKVNVLVNNLQVRKKFGGKSTSSIQINHDSTDIGSLV